MHGCSGNPEWEMNGKMLEIILFEDFNILLLVPWLLPCEYKFNAFRKSKENTLAVNVQANFTNFICAWHTHTRRNARRLLKYTTIVDAISSRLSLSCASRPLFFYYFYLDIARK